MVSTKVPSVQLAAASKGMFPVVDVGMAVSGVVGVAGVSGVVGVSEVAGVPGAVGVSGEVSGDGELLEYWQATGS